MRRLVLLTLAAILPAQSLPSKDLARHLTMMGFTLEKSTLEDVQAVLGKSAATKCPPEESGSMDICYVAAGRDKIRVVFEAGFSGSWKELDGFKVIAGSLDLPCYRQCPIADQVSSDVQTAGGLKLGLTRKQLVALLGPPKEAHGNQLTFLRLSRRPMTNGPKQSLRPAAGDAYWDVQDTIDVTLLGSRVVQFEVHHFVTS